MKTVESVRNGHHYRQVVLILVKGSYSIMNGYVEVCSISLPYLSLLLRPRPFHPPPLQRWEV